MNERTKCLQELRPQLKRVKISELMSSEERFQNNTLRPILKFQNELLLLAFKNHIKKRKNVFQELKPEKKALYIKNTIQKDIKLRSSLKGMVIGYLTLDEYQEYIKNSSALNKRMMNMIIKRLQDQIQYFEEILI